MYFTEISLFLHIFRLDNEVLKLCFFLIVSQQNLSMRYDFDIAVNICTMRDIRGKTSDLFSCVVHRN